MPQVAATTVLQLALLLSAIPAQYLISRWSGPTAAQRYHATTRLRGIWREWRASYLNSTAWKEWASEHTSRVRSLVGLGEEGPVPEESPAPEKWTMLNNDQGFFGASKAARSPRPPFVFLRVGEVVRETKGHMVGVVIGWDAELRAPPEWVSRMYSNQETKAEKTPHYKVLFSGPRASSVMVAYLPQTQLERITGVELEVPTLEQYFTHFNGRQFVMRTWLRKLYPEDEDEDEEWPN